MFAMIKILSVAKQTNEPSQLTAAALISFVSYPSINIFYPLLPIYTIRHSPLSKPTAMIFRPVAIAVIGESLAKNVERLSADNLEAVLLVS